ncbi:hypothetical protein JL722_8874 [Aureococcus anophagefferens]|nr:hypothetical protein JL722_8874 [Aureococcus anophagefferens]
MVTASGERIVGKAISADSPAFFHVAHAEVNPELGRRLKRSKGPPFVPGKDRIEAARRAAVSTHASLRDPPSGVAHAHGVALSGDGSAAPRQRAESYVEQAAESSDLLVWQRTQDRDEDFSSPLQTLRPVSRVDYYDARPPFSNYVGELGRTARLATAPALGRRHRGGARARSAMGRGRRGRGDGAAPALAALRASGRPAGLARRPTPRRGREPGGGGDDGALYRVVSVYRADNGGARVVCYDPRTCAYGRLLLLEERLEELHVGPAPARDADYPAWSRGLVERLELGAEGDLRVGRQPLQPNGLTLDFSLSGHRERARRRVGRAAPRAGRPRAAAARRRRRRVARRPPPPAVAPHGHPRFDFM